MPFANQIVTGECKNITIGFEDSYKLISQSLWVKFYRIPLRQIIVDILSPTDFDIAGGVQPQIIRRIGQNQIHTLAGYFFNQLKRISLKQITGVVYHR